MSNPNMEDRLKKLREERVAREKARIEKLREMNLKKYTKNESLDPIANNPLNSGKLVKSNSVTSVKSISKHVKNNFHVNGTAKRPISVPTPKKRDYANVKPKVITKNFKTNEAKGDASDNVAENKNESKPIASTSGIATDSKTTKNDKKINQQNLKIGKLSNNQIAPKNAERTSRNVTENKPQKLPAKIEVLKEIPNQDIKNLKFNPKTRKSIAVPSDAFSYDKLKPISRKSMLPKLLETKSESVFERLYKPKIVQKKVTNEVEKLRNDPDYLKKITKKTGLILGGINRRHSTFDNGNAGPVFPRRSISAVHLKKICKNEIHNCIHKWSSVGDKLNSIDLQVNEDEKINEDKIISAIKSERKVKFLTPLPSNLNTPRPEELQSRLKSWLQKRGKSIDSYHHLQCFGLHHLRMDLGTPKHNPEYTITSLFDDDNKENIALDSDSDDGSFLDNMNEGKERVDNKIDIHNWRRASLDSESVGFNESNNLNETTITSADTVPNIDEVLIGALNDLTSLLREGFSWQQSARWLRCIRGRFPQAPRLAAYWECRAALEDSRGDLPASVQCWEQAVAQGTEHSVVEANLDQLLDKFMQLKISPKSGAPREPDPKMLDVKNVFKSTIIRFAVQQAKLRRQSETPVFTVTPVRRSARLSHCPNVRTPLRLCDNMRQAASFAPEHVFTPNDNLAQTP